MMLQYILSIIIFLEVKIFLSSNIIKGPILKDIAKINRTSKIFVPSFLSMDHYIT